MLNLSTFSVLQELFSSNSPNALYEKAANECMANTRVSEVLLP